MIYNYGKTIYTLKQHLQTLFQAIMNCIPIMELK